MSGVNVLCKLEKIGVTAEAMCNQNWRFLASSLQPDKGGELRKYRLFQNRGQGRDRRSVEDRCARYFAPTLPCNLGEQSVRRRKIASEIKEIIVDPDA